MMSTNQIGRELARRLVENTGCDLQTAVRFFYNSKLYTALNDSAEYDMDSLYSRFETEYTKGVE